MTYFCDACGDQTIAVRPIKITLWDGREIHGNLCLGCSEKVGKSRKVTVSRFVKWLLGSGQ